MSHLDGSQIQKAIILAFPIPFWQNSTSVFERHVHWKKTSVWNLSRKESAKVSYITSINPAAAGKFLHQNFQAKEHYSITISYNIDALVKAKGKLESLNKETTEQDNALFMANGLRLKPGMQCKHSANQKFLESILSIQSTVEETLELLQKARELREFSLAEEMLSKESRESRSKIAVRPINANANATQKMKSQLKQEF